ncbi:hypothetical protein [Crystallibacter crystallopoietes]|uniref:hypothetical protein n=1 Tax=Crystallibacter crystallopoietes TaxID=37928 RepID=UPI0002FF6835|nr:hypothetical protein [Arthrobacter crystallopoietes]
MAEFTELVARRAAQIAEAEAAMMAEHRAALALVTRSREAGLEKLEELLRTTAAAQLAEAGIPAVRTGGRFLSRQAWLVGQPVFRRGTVYRGEYAVPVLLGAGGEYALNALVVRGEGGVQHSTTRLVTAWRAERARLLAASDDFPPRLGRADLLLGSGRPVLS